MDYCNLGWPIFKRQVAHIKGEKKQQPSKDELMFFRYCLELDGLHSDLVMIRLELEKDAKAYSAEQSLWPLMKFSLTYHVENFYIRIHAYCEKVFQLLNHAFALGIHPRAEKFNNQVWEKIRERKLTKLIGFLTTLKKDEPIRKARERRNAFIHRLTQTEQPELSYAYQLLFDPLRPEEDKVLEDAVTTWKESEKLSTYYQNQIQEMEAMVAQLKEFRDNLCAELQCNSVLELVDTPSV